MTIEPKRYIWPYQYIVMWMLFSFVDLVIGNPPRSVDLKV